MLTDSFGLYFTITTLHKCHEYPLNTIASRLRGLLECGDIEALWWVSGTCYIAHPQTKGNIEAFYFISHTLNDGSLGAKLLQSIVNKHGSWTPQSL